MLIAISETITWGWGSPKTLGLLAVGLVVCAAWVVVEVHSEEPLIDMAMMRIRGVWTTNLVAFLLGAGMYASFLVFPQFAQLPTSTGFGFGASVVVAGLYLLPAALGMSVLGTAAGRVARALRLQDGGDRRQRGHRASRSGWLAVAHGHPYDMLISAALLGIGIGLAFAALGNLIVQAVPPEPDRRGDRHEHGDADAGRRAWRPDRRHLHRQQRRPRPAHGHRVHGLVRAARRCSWWSRCSPARSSR